jgi:transposase InsO family protein
MKKKLAELVALFRYKIIAPVLEKGLGKKEYFAAQAGRIWDVPGYGQKQYTGSTFKSWLTLYRKRGFDALFPRIRADAGKCRKITGDLARVIIVHAELLAGSPVSVFYRSLQSHGLINPPHVSESALRRFVSANRLLAKPADTRPRKKFEKEHINELWISDTMHGPYLQQGKRKRKTYLVGIIDDHSRMLVGTGWFFQENTLALEIVLKEAISRFGLPRLFYCDNGAIFSTQSLSLACARLGIALIHSKPYDSPSRGKIERVWRTIRDKFVSGIQLADIDSLQALNDLFATWLDSDYHKVFHHGINTRPIDRWLEDAKVTRIRMVGKEELDLAFYQSYERKVKKDCTIQFDGVLWQVPPCHVGNKIEIRHPTASPQELYLFENGKPIVRLARCNPAENASSPASSIRFSDSKKEKK